MSFNFADIAGLETYFQCVGALSMLGGALAFRMSLYRLAGSPGDGNPSSPLSKMSELQLLTSEWTPWASCWRSFFAAM
jgi:hypothetical protein